MSKKFNLLFFFVALNLNLLAMESPSVEVSAYNQVNSNLPEFYLDSVKNSTNKNYVLMIGDEVFGIKPGRTLDLFVKKKAKLNLESPSYGNAPKKEVLSHLKFLANADKIKVIQIKPPAVDGEPYRKEYFLKISYNLFKFNNLYKVIVNVSLFDGHYHKIVSAPSLKYGSLSLPRDEGYKIELELIGDDLTGSIIDITGSYK